MVVKMQTVIFGFVTIESSTTIFPSTLNIETAGSSETLVATYLTMQWHNAGVPNLTLIGFHLDVVSESY
jgi:hypothetical protein